MIDALHGLSQIVPEFMLPDPDNSPTHLFQLISYLFVPFYCAGDFLSPEIRLGLRPHNQRRKLMVLVPVLLQTTELRKVACESM